MYINRAYFDLGYLELQGLGARTLDSCFFDGPSQNRALLLGTGLYRMNLAGLMRLQVQSLTATHTRIFPYLSNLPWVIVCTPISSDC